MTVDFLLQSSRNDYEIHLKLLAVVTSFSCYIQLRVINRTSQQLISSTTQHRLKSTHKLTYCLRPAFTYIVQYYNVHTNGPGHSNTEASFKIDFRQKRTQESRAIPFKRITCCMLHHDERLKRQMENEVTERCRDR